MPWIILNVDRWPFKSWSCVWNFDTLAKTNDL